MPHPAQCLQHTDIKRREKVMRTPWHILPTLGFFFDYFQSRTGSYEKMKDFHFLQ
jgi:hypothetical protein